MATESKSNNATNTAAMTSSSSRPLRLHQRPDLEVQQQSYQGRDYWVIKDPISLKYYRFEEEEFALLEMLDGQSSPDQIKRRFDYRFAPQKITMQELYQFAGMLYRSSLVVSDAPNQGAELLKRGEKTRKAERRQSLTNILSIRYKGFDPDHLLGVMIRYVGCFFTWPAFVFALLLGISAGALLITQFETFQNKLPAFDDFFAAKNWIWLAMVMAVTKVLHEFGHGLACKKFGGQCHEMGIMLLVLTPCLYANVSDSWLLNSKWKRAFIAAAGMYVELVLAAFAVFVWWFSTPGMVNQLALNVIFVSSVSTLLFNANPLLRYDGYYILSDLLEIPNLRSKATTILQRTCGALFLGIEAQPDPFLPTRNRWMFGLYSVAAASYRWLITFSIFWFVYRVLEPYGFKVIGQMIAISAIYGLIGIPLVKLYKFFSVPGRFGTVKPFRATVAAGVVACLLAAIMLIPIPHYVYCSFYVTAEKAHNVYVDVPGTLEEIHLQPNQMVKEDQPIISLSSQQLRVQLASHQTEVNITRVRYENIEQAGSLVRDEGREAAEVAVQSALDLLTKRQLDRERLIVCAPVAGYLLAPSIVEADNSDLSTLTEWEGTPLERRNIGAYLKQSTFVGQVVEDMTKLEAVLAIDQSDIEFVRPDQPVEMLVRQVPLKVFESVTQQISPTEMKSTPKSLSSQYGGDIVTTRGKEGEDVPQSTKYLVNVALANPNLILLPGSTGVAKIRTGTQTIGQRVWRLASQTFQFEL
ncbi:MAG: site-2 protease family protein [Mariniblastus sp.]